jgi:hypothetical protein
MPVVGPDLVEPSLHRGDDVDGVARAQRSRLGQVAGQLLDLAQDPIGNGNQEPSFVADVFQKVFPQRRRALRAERPLPNLAMDAHASSAMVNEEQLTSSDERTSSRTSRESGSLR